MHVRAAMPSGIDRERIQACSWPRYGFDNFSQLFRTPRSHPTFLLFLVLHVHENIQINSTDSNNALLVH